MSIDVETTRIVRSWLEEGRTALPDHVLDAILDEVPATRQRRSRWPTRRSDSMSTSARLAIGVAAVAVIVVAGIGLASAYDALLRRIDDGPAAQPQVDLGVFEPARGRIVFRVGGRLVALDPDDPTSTAFIDLPEGIGENNIMPANWSTDGSKLALSNESALEDYVLERSGIAHAVPGSRGGCCWFVPHAWMSPDGREALVSTVVGLSIVDLASGAARPTGIGPGMAMAVWSPDGRAFAHLTAHTRGDDPWSSAPIAITDASTGVSRTLVDHGWGYVRQLVWSPDGSRLLVVGAADGPPPRIGVNPLVDPWPASLWTVDIDDGEVRAIASGHFVAAAWSPDGTQVAAIDFPGRRDVVAVPVDGSAAPRLLRTLSGDTIGFDRYLFTGVVWHPAPRAS
jgi:hypothetical protein